MPAAQYNSSLNVAIGDRPGGSTPFNGRIDDVRIYDRALTDAEVASLGPLRFSSIKCLEDQCVLSWTGHGQLEWANEVTGPWNLVSPAPTPPYSAMIVPSENRFFRVSAIP